MNLTRLTKPALADLLGERQRLYDACKADLEAVREEIIGRGLTEGRGKRWSFQLKTTVSRRVDVGLMVRELGERFVDRFRVNGKAKRWTVTQLDTTAQSRVLEDV